MRSLIRLCYILIALTVLSLPFIVLPASARVLTPAPIDLSDHPAVEFTSPHSLVQSSLKVEPLARSGNWIYYLKPCSPSKWQQAEMYRAKPNGSEESLILSVPLGSVRDMQFIKGWIYYKAANGSLHRIRCDGTEDCQLAGHAVQYEVRGPYVFYIWIDGLYRVDTSTGSSLHLDGGFADYYVSRIDRIEGDWIYYQLVTSQQYDPLDHGVSYFTYGLYRIKMDGSQKTTIIEDRLRGGSKGSVYPQPICLAFSGEYVYYAAPNRKDGAIFAVKSNGADRIMVCTNPDNAPHVTEIFVQNNWLYYKYSYSPQKNLAAVYKVKVDGSARVRLLADIKQELYPDDYWIARALSDNTNVDFPWIYYNTRHEIYRIKADGSAKSLVYDAGTHDIYWMELRGNYLFFTWVETSNTWEIKEWRCRLMTDGSGFTKIEASY